MSSAISKFTSALLAGSQENTLALAALNFDFSLYKVEAPTEYQALATCLSHERKNVAESGQQHVTARRLGALFRTELPPAPSLSSLIQVYGRRVCEIAKTSSIAQSSRDGIFSQYTGIDGTSIWAAATSGREALCVQLLACMLARFWTAPEAISIWMELIETRKKNLQVAGDDSNFQEIFALQATLSRESIAEWDASARSWLRTADAAFAKEHIQLRLIAENVKTDVSTKPSTYESVKDAWISAMTAADRLIQGIAQVTHTGAVLLGLSAWHLYPDMLVYGQETQEIKQKDPLISKTGLLTVGLQLAPGVEDGVRWSLPLAKLRYYGKPIVVSKRLNPHDDLVSYEDFMLIVFGGFLVIWNLIDLPEEECRKMCELLRCLLQSYQAQRRTTVSYLQDLERACSSYLATEGQKKSRVQRLVALGTRQSERLLAGESSYLLTTILSPPMYVRCLSETEDRVDYLRELVTNLEAGSFEDTQSEWLIEYKHPKHGMVYATAGLQRSSQTSHRRWRSAPKKSRTRKAVLQGEELHNMHGWTLESDLVEVEYRKVAASGTPVLVHSRKASTTRQTHRLQFSWRVEELGWKDDAFMTQFNAKDVASTKNASKIRFLFYHGDPGFAALYRRQRRHASRADMPPEVSVKVGTVLSAFQRGHIDTNPILDNISDATESNGTLQALSMVAKVYSSLPGALISTKVTKDHICNGKWFGSPTQVRPQSWYSTTPMSRAQAFSCIALFETGETQLDPNDLQNLMALSAGDSLYLAAPLLRDPADVPDRSQVMRVLGNIGRPGMSLLFPPANPESRSNDTGSWELITHENYDGKAEDSFANTSLHLSLTEYRVPFANVHEGARDIQTFFQEAVVSIYDGSEWISDLDVLASLEKKPNLERLSADCPHVPDGIRSRQHEVRDPHALTNTAQQTQTQTKKRVILSMADNWHELLDRPKNPVVARAHGNWLARLAITALGVQKGYVTFVIPETSCKDCFGDPNRVKEWACAAYHLVVY